MNVLRRAALALVLGLALIATSAAGASSDVSDVGERSFAEVAACAARADHVLVSFVVDESGSLQRSDPQNARVGALAAAVDALQSAQDQATRRAQGQGAGSPGAEPPSIEANLAVFGGAYTELVQWGAVEAGHAGELLAAVQSELPQRNRAEFTDYRAALRDAQASIDARAAQLGGTSCSLIVWFTDGELDIQGSEADAWRELCEPRGLVDGIRGRGSAIIAVALFSDTVARPVSPESREALRAVAEGTAQGTSCGQVPIPSGFRAGAYLRADDPGALRRLFAKIGALMGGGTENISAICPSGECPDGALPIALDPGIEGFRAVLDTSGDGVPPRLVAPDGSQIELLAGDYSIGGASVLVTARDGLTVASVTQPRGPEGAVVWTLESGASDASPAIVDLYYFWGAVLAIDAPAGMVIGSENTVEVLARFSDGSPVDPARYSRLDLRLEADGESVPLAWEEPGRAVGKLTLPVDGAPAQVALSVVGSATSSPSGVAVGPATAARRFDTVTPPSFPKLETTTLVFPSLVGTTSSGSVVELTGSDEGPTRACLADHRLEGPSRAGSIDLVGSECVDIPVGETVNWPFKLQTTDTADGNVAGTARLVLVAVQGRAELPIELGVAATMSRPVDAGSRNLLLAILVAIAAIIPFLIGWIGNAVSARFPVGPRTRVASVPVVLTSHGLQRADGATTLFGPGDFEPLRRADEARLRSLAAGGLVFTRHLPVNPFRDPTAWVTRPNRVPYVASTHWARPWETPGRRARAEFGLDSNLYLLLDPDGSGDLSGRLVSVAEDRTGLSDLLPATLDQVAANATLWGPMYEALSEMARAAESMPKRATAKERETSSEPDTGQPVEPPPNVGLWTTDPQFDPANPRAGSSPQPPSPASPFREPDDHRPPSIFDH